MEIAAALKRIRRFACAWEFTAGPQSKVVDVTIDKYRWGGH